jgi:hypothetical protein
MPEIGKKRGVYPVHEQQGTKHRENVRTPSDVSCPGIRKT